MELRRDDQEHIPDLRRMLARGGAYPATDGRGLSGVVGKEAHAGQAAEPESTGSREEGRRVQDRQIRAREAGHGAFGG